jgi:glycosyltransferase involved in cell wall biosynthesis
MKVTISIGGRFHAFDLARQLQRRDMLGRLITSYPKSKVGEWGIDADKIDSLISHELLARGWRYIAPRLKLRGQPQFLFNDRFDRMAARHIPRATDIFVAWGGMALHGLQRAQQLGAKAILERNSTHIVFQRDILAEEYARVNRQASLPDPRFVERELAEYGQADYICVPSSFAYRSFLAHGVPAEKVFLVPFGVDGENFNPVPKRDKVFRVIHCGALSIRKGVQYLLQAFHELALKDAELWLIGTHASEIEPYLKQYGGPNVQLRGTFPQAQLFEQYSQGSVFCLASIEEGFGMVISQAMACGLPAIVTPNTTGGDIVRDGVDGFVIPIRDVRALKERISWLYENQERCREMGESARKQIQGGFTWDHYGQRIAAQYARIHAGQFPQPYEVPGAETGISQPAVH